MVHLVSDGKPFRGRSRSTMMQSRYYNLETGRFLTRDEFDGDQKRALDVNKYIYVANNPVMFVDPDGFYLWRKYGDLRVYRTVWFKFYIPHSWLSEALSISGGAVTLKELLKRKGYRKFKELTFRTFAGVYGLYLYSLATGKKGVTISLNWLVYKKKIRRWDRRKRRWVTVGWGTVLAFSTWLIEPGRR